MATPTAQQVWSDPDFLQLHPMEKAKVMQKIDPDFSALPPVEQNKVIFQLTGRVNNAPKRTAEAPQEPPMAPGADHDQQQAAFLANEGTLGMRLRDALPSRKTIATIARPILEGAGTVGGGIAGGTSGLLAGLGIGAIPGSVAGAALGYAGGKNVADMIEGDTPQTWTEAGRRTLSDLGTGAAMEMGGQSAGKILGYGLTKAIQAKNAVTTPIKRAMRNVTPAITEQGVRTKAGQVIAENMGDSPIYAQNADEAAKLRIPGYKPSIGEARNDPGLIKLQRGVERQTGTAANTILEQKAANQTAIRDYLDNQFTGNESIDDVISALSKKKTQIETTTKTADLGSKTARDVLNPADTQTVGRGVVDTIDSARIPAKKNVSAMYDGIPNDALPTKNTAAAVKELKGNFRPGDEEVYPSRAIARVEEALQGPKPAAGGHGKPADPVILDAYGKPIRETVDTTKSEVGFQDLHSLRKDLGRQIQDAISGANPNRELAMKLQQLKSAVDADIEAGMGGGAAYKAARDAFSDYATKFRTGQVEQITRRGGQASGLNIPDSQIAKRVFSLDGADDFIRSVGKENAAVHADQYAAQELLSKANPVTGELSAKTVASWLQKNMGILRKYGISGKYANVAKAQAQAEAARATEVEFAKSAASKVIGSDVDKAMDAAFSTNPKNTAATMQDLISKMNGDAKGLQGLQNSFKDFLIGKAETTAKTISGENIISPAAVQKTMAKHAPAMRVLYKNDPAKISALNKVSKAVEIQSRSAKSPLGGGSDTAENLNVAQSILGKIINFVPGGNMAMHLGKVGLGALKNLNATEINNLVAKAIYDPELAQTLVLASRRFKPEVVEKRINSQLLTLGIVGVKNMVNR